MVVLLLNTGEKHLAHCESKEEQDYDSSYNSWSASLRTYKTAFATLGEDGTFWQNFTFSHSRVWPLHHSDTELASLVNVM